ncbi:ABC transporter substrate-binding protein [Pseudomonas panipatensis]|uniref:ABC transporter substrate-binding protein n=1 Tax=Pseudomonas panipatensis TaxID=428992 RepID=UPI000AD7926C|nr:ABC transporter substrate-binding protein [Pseudomonas panipatensis]
MAERWDVAEDGKSYTFHLRDAKFSNREPVTADDVVYSLQRAAGEKSEWVRFFKPITRYEVIDAHTLRLGLDQPFTPMLNNLALFSASILPRKALESTASSKASFLSSAPGSRASAHNSAKGVGVSATARPCRVRQALPSSSSKSAKRIRGDRDWAADAPRSIPIGSEDFSSMLLRLYRRHCAVHETWPCGARRPPRTALDADDRRPPNNDTQANIETCLTFN